VNILHKSSSSQHRRSN